MTTYYISATSGSDSNNGLGPDASHATNKPWATIGKALGASSIASGDTVYLAPGTYREAVTVAMTSATADTSLLGDPTNAQGFKTSGGVLLNAGEIIWTAFTTNDTTATSTRPLDLAGRDFLLFQYITFIGGNVARGCVDGSTTTHAQNMTFRDCTFLSSHPVNVIGYTSVANAAANWLFDRCRFFTNQAAFAIVLATSTTADYDANFVIQNCVFTGIATTVGITASGANSFKGGGIDLLNCTILSGGVMNAGANLATSIPCTVYNCIAFTGTSTGLTANTSGQIVEDYNIIYANTPRSNVSVGTNSSSDFSRAPMFHIGQEVVNGGAQRPFLTPMVGAPQLGFGNQAGAPSVDALNRPRPAGGGSTSNAVGALERHQTAARETSTVQAGSAAIKITGPGDHDLVIPVDASSTSLSIYVRYDTTHGTTNKPQAQLLANGAIGVAAETKTATVGVDTWEQLTFSSFTPTAKGAVTVRLVSRAAGGAGVAYFDTAAGGVNSTAGFDYFRAGEPISTVVSGGSSGGLIGGGTLTGGTQ